MKVAIFVEGHTETIFLTDLFQQYFGAGKIQFSQVRQRGRKRFIPFSFLDSMAQSADHLCLIVESSGDESVLSDLKENYPTMAGKGFDFFFGLRDLRSQRYDEYGDEVITAAQREVARFKSHDNVFLHFAKMEIEAWFLAAPDVFSKIDPRLSLSAIESNTGYDLVQIDPQEYVPAPAKLLDTILRLANLRYRKHKNEVHRIVSRIDWENLCYGARESGKVSNFFGFLDDIAPLFSDMPRADQRGLPRGTP
jgi:Domain of unknown function (DUF4276)